MAKKRDIKSYHVFVVYSNGKKTRTYSTNKLKKADNRFLFLATAARPDCTVVLLNTKKKITVTQPGRRNIPKFESLRYDKLQSCYYY